MKTEEIIAEKDIINIIIINNMINIVRDLEVKTIIIIRIEIKMKNIQ